MLFYLLFIVVINAQSIDDNLKYCAEGFFRQSDSRCVQCTLFCFSKDLTPDQKEVCKPFCSTTVPVKLMIQTTPSSTNELDKGSNLKYLWFLILIFIVIIVVILVVFKNKLKSIFRSQNNSKCSKTYVDASSLNNGYPNINNIPCGSGAACTGLDSKDNVSAPEQENLLMHEVNNSTEKDNKDNISASEQKNLLSPEVNNSLEKDLPGSSNQNFNSLSASSLSSGVKVKNLVPPRINFDNTPSKMEDEAPLPTLDDLELFANDQEISEDSTSYKTSSFAGPSLKHDTINDEDLLQDIEIKDPDSNDDYGFKHVENYNSIQPTPVPQDLSRICERRQILPSLNKYGSIVSVPLKPKAKDVRIKYNEPKKLQSIIEKTESEKNSIPALSESLLGPESPLGTSLDIDLNREDITNESPQEEILTPRLETNDYSSIYYSLDG